MANPNPVYIDFIVRGIPNVQKAFKTVQDAALAAERAQTQRARGESTQRTRLADQEARAKVRAAQQAGKAQIAAAKQASRETDKAARDSAKAVERAERDKERAADRSARNIARIRERSASMAGQFARKQADEERRANFVRERDEMRNRRRFASHMGGAAVGGAQAGVQRVAGLTVKTANMVGQLGGGFSIADSVQRNAKNAGDTADLINAGINTMSANRKNRTRRDRGDVEGALDVATTQYGMDRSSAIGGLRSFTSKTGDFDTALKLLPKLAQLSRATGTDLDKMAGAAGQVGLSFDDMTDGEAKMEKIMQVMRVVAGQGKAGTVEISDMATQMGKLVATANKFDGDNVENLSKMGMLAQFAAGGGGAWSASSAATSVTSFGSVFGKGARLNAFKAKGIDVFTDKGETKLKAPEEIIADAFAKTKGKQSEVAGLFGSAMALRAVNKFGTAYSNGYTDNAGNKLKGREAVLGMAKDMSHTQMTQKEVEDSASSRMQELDAKMAVVQENFDKAVREKIIPALLALVPEFERLVPQFVELNQKALPAFVDLFKTIAKFAEAHKGEIDFLASHPIAAILTAEIGKQVAMAGISELFKVGIAKAMGDAGMGAVIQRVLSSSLGAGGLMIGTAAMTILAAKMLIDKEVEDDVSKQQGVFAHQAEAANLLTKLNRGEGSEADKAQAAQLVKTLGADKQGVEAGKEEGFVKRMSYFTGRLTGQGSSIDEAQAAEARNRETAISDLNKTMKQLEAALRDNTGATKASAPGGAAGKAGGEQQPVSRPQPR